MFLQAIEMFEVSLTQVLILCTHLVYWSCASKAVGKDGKPLAGAAKTSFIRKCCTDSAIGKDGKPLSGAAKASFVKKCMKG